MKATDVRVNNWVLFEGKPFRINLISEDWPFLNTPEFGVGVVSWDNISGIPLTPELLEKAGFTDNAVGVLAIELWDIANHLEIISPGDTYFYPQIDQMQDMIAPQSVALTRISYLHELQNLYHILTGEELQITF